MNIKELRKLFDQGKRRYHVVGDDEAGVVIGLDLEGRLYAVLDGEVLNRVNPEALTGQSSIDGYLNPGGDGLWPAPEGSRFGYQYAAGKWRVPPGLTGARYRIVAEDAKRARVRAEIDLINSRGLGIPLAFEREVEAAAAGPALTVTVRECIEYMGISPLTRRECLIAPWTLAQFDCCEGAEVVFPGPADLAVHDLYDSSADQRRYDGELWHTRTDGGPRYQIGLTPEVEWIEYRHPARGLTVRRGAAPLADGLSYIDIADRPPEDEPLALPVRFSVYSDPSKFMEIEAAGGCPEIIQPGARLELTVTTIYKRG